jgi:3-dehydroquinate synthase
MKSYNFKFEDKKVYKSEVIIQENSLIEYDLLSVLDKSSTHLILTDKNLEKYHLEKMLKRFENTEYNYEVLIVDADESSKSLKVFTSLVDKSLEYHFDKNSTVITLGGGVVCNLGGFLASTLYRGIKLIHIPTSLLSQVDAAISFKQAINHSYGKNLIGGYHSADKIIIDPNVLMTLDLRLLKDGIAEAVKHALCQDLDFCNFFNSVKFDFYNKEFLLKLIVKTIELKMDVMDGDVTKLKSDYNESIKHYGHSVGHAIEHISKGKFYHGESISIGMCISAEVSYLLGICSQDVVEKHYSIFSNIGLPTSIPSQYSIKDIITKMQYDKHYLNGKSYFGLVQEIGVMAKVKEDIYGYYVSDEIILKAMEKNRLR